MVLQGVKLRIGRAISRAAFLLRKWRELVPGQLFEQLGSPSLMLWRMVSAMERLVRLAALRISPSRSAGIANGYVSDFMEESHSGGGDFQVLCPPLHKT